jgi:DNA-binding PadR family transcriptional regulator
MSAVFSHGRLRLYLLKLLSDGPKHGYELIRLLENRFFGLYAPSAGTIYPRLARMEADGLISHTAAGGRKVYEITEAGRTELKQRAKELAELETEIQGSVADLTALAGEVEQGVRGSIRDLKQELREAAREAKQQPQSDEWRRWLDAWKEMGPPPWLGPSATSPPPTELERKAVDLASEVRRLVRAGRATEEDLRVAGSLLDSVRDQIRRLLRG